MSVNWITKKIKDSGLRVTEQRKEVARFLVVYDGVFSAQDVMVALPDLDKVSVYRTIDVLLELDAIRPTVQMDGAQYYEVRREDKHHHHVVCTGCRQTQCIPCSFRSPSVEGFSSVQHTVSFTGVCNGCIK